MINKPTVILLSSEEYQRQFYKSVSSGDFISTDEDEVFIILLEDNTIIGLSQEDFEFCLTYVEQVFGEIDKPLKQKYTSAVRILEILSKHQVCMVAK